MSKIAVLPIVFLLCGCHGDRIIPEHIKVAEVKIQNNQICIYTRDAENAYTYDYIKVMKNGDKEWAVYDLKNQKIKASGCIPFDTYQFKETYSYAADFTVRNEKGKSKRYVISLDVYKINGRLEYKKYPH